MWRSAGANDRHTGRGVGQTWVGDAEEQIRRSIIDHAAADSNEVEETRLSSTRNDATGNDTR